MNIALWNEKGIHHLYLFEGIDSGSTLIPRRLCTPKIKPNSSIVVRTDTICNIINEFNIDLIDWVKINVEGAERIALQGMNKTLKASKYLIIEICKDSEQIIKYLKSKGFQLKGKREENYFFKKEHENLSN